MDFTRFERLKGIALGRFVEGVVKHEKLDDSILHYYSSHVATLDEPHLEMLILLLGALATGDAIRAVAKYLDHPTTFVRYQAIQVIAGTSVRDEEVRERIVAALANPRSTHKALEDALYRYEAR